MLRAAGFSVGAFIIEYIFFQGDLLVLPALLLPLRESLLLSPLRFVVFGSGVPPVLLRGQNGVL
jgi:hypothetical protein